MQNQNRFARETPTGPGTRWLLLGLLAIALSPALALMAADDELDPMVYFVGEFDLVLTDQAGNIVGKATSHGYPVLDETMLQIDYRSVDRSGAVVFWGTTLRTRRPKGGYVVRWAMSNLEGHTYIEEEWRDGALHGSGSGFDASGEFLERYRYFDFVDGGYSFQLERSTDSGSRWEPGPTAKATRRN